MPDNETLIIHTDGGSRGNPGPAAAGLVISDSSGRKLFSAGYFLGTATNNVAEYQGLIKALQQASKMTDAKLEVYTDSELMTRQINGIYKVKNAKLKPLYEQVINLIARFKSVTVTHVRREKNKLADEMANIAMDRRGDCVRDNTADASCDGQTDMPDGQSPTSVTAGVRLTASCTCGCDSSCPAAIEKGQLIDLPGMADGNICMYAVAGIVNAFLAAGDSEGFTARCARPDCPASFDVAVIPL